MRSEAGARPQQTGSELDTMWSEVAEGCHGDGERKLLNSVCEKKTKFREADAL